MPSTVNYRQQVDDYPGLVVWFKQGAITNQTPKYETAYRKL